MCMSENRWTHPQAGQRAHVPRQANLELLRCIAMMMVIVLHYLGKGGLLVSLEEAALCPAGLLAWLLESFCIVAVNVYMLISGYFLSVSSFRPSRLIQLWLQVWSYSIAIGLLGALTGVIEETAFDTHFLLTLLFPISMDHYWFLTAYFFLYLLLPFLGTAVRHMTKRQLQIAALLLLFAFSVQKSILPVRLETDGLGYDCLWYVCVCGRRLYQEIRSWLSRKKGLRRRPVCGRVPGDLRGHYAPAADISAHGKPGAASAGLYGV